MPVFAWICAINPHLFYIIYTYIRMCRVVTLLNPFNTFVSYCFAFIWSTENGKFPKKYILRCSIKPWRRMLPPVDIFITHFHQNKSSELMLLYYEFTGRLSAENGVAWFLISEIAEQNRLFILVILEYSRFNNNILIGICWVSMELIERFLLSFFLFLIMTNTQTCALIYIIIMKPTVVCQVVM